MQISYSQVETYPQNKIGNQTTVLKATPPESLDYTFRGRFVLHDFILHSILFVNLELVNQTKRGSTLKIKTKT